MCPVKLRWFESNPSHQIMQPVLDGIEGTPYKRVHIVRLNGVVPNKRKDEQYGKV